MLVINGVLGQGLVARFERNLRPSPDFAMLELPNWLTVLGAALLIGAILLPGTLGYFTKSAVFILALPFFLVGLSVIHVAARRISAGTLLLVLFYLLMLLFGWPAVFARGLLRTYANRGLGSAKNGPAPARRSKMEVILLERIERLGQMGDVVNVKPGYARNFLLPQKKALRATKANLEHFEGNVGNWKLTTCNGETKRNPSPLELFEFARRRGLRQQKFRDDGFTFATRRAPLASRSIRSLLRPSSFMTPARVAARLSISRRPQRGSGSSRTN